MKKVVFLYVMKSLLGMQKYRLLPPITSGCYGVLHPDVIHNNIRMF